VVNSLSHTGLSRYRCLSPVAANRFPGDRSTVIFPFQRCVGSDFQNEKSKRPSLDHRAAVGLFWAAKKTFTPKSPRRNGVNRITNTHYAQSRTTPIDVSFIGGRTDGSKIQQYVVATSSFKGDIDCPRGQHDLSQCRTRYHRRGNRWRLTGVTRKLHTGAVSTSTWGNDNGPLRRLGERARCGFDGIHHTNLVQERSTGFKATTTSVQRFPLPWHSPWVVRAGTRCHAGPRSHRRELDSDRRRVHHRREGIAVLPDSSRDTMGTLRTQLPIGTSAAITSNCERNPVESVLMQNEVRSDSNIHGTGGLSAFAETRHHVEEERKNGNLVLCHPVS